MTKLTILTATLTLCLLSACATYTPPVEKDFAKTKIINTSYDQAWEKATEWFANGNVPIKNIAKDSGLIATDYKLRASSRDIDCGTLGQMDAFQNKRANMNIFIKEVSPTSVSVSINVFGNAIVTTMAGSAYATSKDVECVSTGSLEKSILDAVKQ